MAKKNKASEPQVEKTCLIEEKESKTPEKALSDILTVFQHLSAQLVETICFLKREAKEQKDFLQEISRTNTNVDETLGNVLLAIRQNEYLQAHYPAQLGYPEMKVVGKHPINIKPKGKR